MAGQTSQSGPLAHAANAPARDGRKYLHAPRSRNVTRDRTPVDFDLFAPVRCTVIAPSSKMADRVLVVDDEQSLRKVLAATLQREGYEVQVASDGEEALAALDRDGADVVVTDLVMPRMDGLSLLRKVVASTGRTVIVVRRTAAWTAPSRR